MDIIEALSRLRIATSFRAYLLPAKSASATTSINVRFSTVYSPEYNDSRQQRKSLGDTSAKNPNLPIFTTMMGIDFSTTLLTDFRNVPSPPMDMTKSESKSSPQNTLLTSTLTFC